MRDVPPGGSGWSPRPSMAPPSPSRATSPFLPRSIAALKEVIGNEVEGAPRPPGQTLNSAHNSIDGNLLVHVEQDGKDTRSRDAVVQWQLHRLSGPPKVLYPMHVIHEPPRMLVFPLLCHHTTYTANQGHSHDFDSSSSWPLRPSRVSHRFLLPPSRAFVMPKPAPWRIATS